VKAAPSGEHPALERLGVPVTQVGKGFIPSSQSPEFPAHLAAARSGLQQAQLAISSGDYDVVLLDEICVAVDRGLLDETSVIQAVNTATENMTIIMTGRGASTGLIDLADTVTEMRCVRHSMQAGQKPQKGVEL